jgi:hypothetical protein
MLGDYLKLLMKDDSATIVSRKVGINRTTVYRIKNASYYETKFSVADKILKAYGKTWANFQWWRNNQK